MSEKTKFTIFGKDGPLSPPLVVAYLVVMPTDLHLDHAYLLPDLGTKFVSASREEAPAS